MSPGPVSARPGSTGPSPPRRPSGRCRLTPRCPRRTRPSGTSGTTTGSGRTASASSSRRSASTPATRWPTSGTGTCSSLFGGCPRRWPRSRPAGSSTRCRWSCTRTWAAALLRRAHRRGNRRGPRPITAHRQARVAPGPGLAAPGAARAGVSFTTGRSAARRDRPRRTARAGSRTPPPRRSLPPPSHGPTAPGGTAARAADPTGAPTSAWGGSR